MQVFIFFLKYYEHYTNVYYTFNMSFLINYWINNHIYCIYLLFLTGLKFLTTCLPVYYSTVYFMCKVQNLLTIGFNNLHPPLFYINIYLFIFNFKKLNTNINKLISLAVFVLVLGMFWALNLDNWGALWNFDYIEYTYLFIISFFICRLHLQSNLVWKLHNMFNTFIIFLITILRLGFLRSRHQFFNNKLDINYCLYSVYILLLIRSRQVFLKHLTPLYIYIYIILNLKNLALLYILLLCQVESFRKTALLKLHLIYFFFLHSVLALTYNYLFLQKLLTCNIMKLQSFKIIKIKFFFSFNNKNLIYTNFFTYFVSFKKKLTSFDGLSISKLHKNYFFWMFIL